MAQSVREYARGIGTTVWSIWHGLSVTLSYLLRRPITVQYPDRTPLPVREMLPPRYRGFLEVDVAICTGCQACERACPIGCIVMELEKDPQNPKQRLVTQFDIDEAKCMFCGLCVEPCPTGSIQHTREFEGSVRHIRNLTFRWSDPLKPWPVYKVPKDATFYPRAPLGAILRPMLEARAWDAPAPEFLPPEPAPAPGPAPAAKPAVKPAAAKGAAAAPAAPATPAAAPAAAAAPGAAAAPAPAAATAPASASASATASAPASASEAAPASGTVPTAKKPDPT
jgi:NADH-quinone oxidoreductase subunit I/NAD(P)H-quinone oxidoreductase subunit I